MKVEFLTGYRGWITNEVYYQAGDVAEFGPKVAHYLMENGRAVVVEPKPIEATPSATKLAVEHNVNLAKVAGSGADGRILIGDVKDYLDG